jgi:hypothetical protein
VVLAVADASVIVFARHGTLQPELLRGTGLSSATNVGADKNLDKRQREAIATFARRTGYDLVDEYYDQAVRGADVILPDSANRQKAWRSAGPKHQIRRSRQVGLWKGRPRRTVPADCGVIGAVRLNVGNLLRQKSVKR